MLNFDLKFISGRVLKLGLFKIEFFQSVYSIRKPATEKRYVNKKVYRVFAIVNSVYTENHGRRFSRFYKTLLDKEF